MNNTNKENKVKDKNEIDIGKMGVALVSLATLSPFVFPNIDMSLLSKAPAILECLGYSMFVGAGTFLTLDASKKFNEKRKEK